MVARVEMCVWYHNKYVKITVTLSDFVEATRCIFITLDHLLYGTLHHVTKPNIYEEDLSRHIYK